MDLQLLKDCHSFIGSEYLETPIDMFNKPILDVMESLLKRLVIEIKQEEKVLEAIQALKESNSSVATSSIC